MKKSIFDSLSLEVEMGYGKMKYSQDDLLKLHEIELQILNEVVRVCEENEIKYFTVSGTTLGAIRHNGFIPWDDDIDIGMLRGDYDKFLEVAPKELCSGYTMQHFFVEEKTPTYFAKVRRDDTLFVEECIKDIQMHKGIFIDIMPFDFLPNNKLIRRIHMCNIAFLMQLFIAKSIRKACTTTVIWKKTVVAIFRKILSIFLLPVPKKTLFLMLDNSLKKYNNTGIVYSVGCKRLECAITDLLPVKKCKFENMTVNVPANFNKILKMQYGNYMKLPSKEQQINHRPCELKF